MTGKPAPMDDEAFKCQMEGKPCDRWCGANPCLAEHELEHEAERESGLPAPASAAPEVAAPVTRKEPEPLVANRDGTAAAYDIKRIILDAVLAAENEGRARGLAEGLEEGAKVACKACLDEFCKFEELLPESFTLNQMEEMVEASIQIAVRAKIKPGSGEEEK